MKLLAGQDAAEAEQYFKVAAEVAREASCLKSQCGSIIVKDGEIIGRGFNGPPLGEEANRTCEAEYNSTQKPLFDKTCCIHAEWRAVLDAAKHYANKLHGSRLYFMRVKNGELTKAGDPYCTVCSRLTMEAGVAEFALWQEQGVVVWNLSEYDQESYAFFNRLDAKA